MKQGLKEGNRMKDRHSAKYKKPTLVKYRNLLKSLHGVTQTTSDT